MSGRRIFVMTSVSAVVCLTVLGALYLPNIMRSGTTHGSSDVSDSKERGVFIQQYHTGMKVVVAFDSIAIPIEEIWIEKHWTYGSITGTIDIDTATSRTILCIRCSGGQGRNNRVTTDDQWIDIVEGDARLSFYHSSLKFFGIWTKAIPDTLHFAIVRYPTKEIEGEIRGVVDTGAVLDAWVRKE
ncbi:MAG: hypothetical protein IPF59_00085 [Ignavibacteria bacterium]|nr:hypothetical protein [Ignavibacteria bacterium]